MIAKQLVRSVAGLLAFAAVVLAPERGEAQRPKTAPTKKPTTQTPTVQPTASEGSTAMAMRGRPANPAAAKAVANALKTALAKPAVKNAVRAEVLRQLRSQRPIAIVSGAWVTVINMRQMYAVPIVQAELLASLGSNGPQLIGGAGGLAVAFTRVSLGKLLMPDMVRGVEATIGVDALKSHMTDGLLGDIIGGALDGVAGVIDDSQVFPDEVGDWFERAADAARYGPDSDWDMDGIPASQDDDDDGDKVPDTKDRFPNDSSKSICDCGRPQAMAFGSVTTDFLPTLINGVRAAARAPRVALGPAIAGQPGILAIVF